METDDAVCRIERFRGRSRDMNEPVPRGPSGTGDLHPSFTPRIVGSIH